MLLAAAVLAGCASPGPDAAAPSADAPSATSPAATSSDGDSAATSDAAAPDGAREIAEPALHLTTVAADGAVHHLELASGVSREIARIAPVDDVVTDGRYVFGIREGSVTVVDSGAWTWSHGDHFHYYVGPARVLGEIDGPGTPTVVPGERGIGIHFGGGEAVLVKTAPLADGAIDELFRVRTDDGEGRVVPLAYGAWVTEQDRNGDVVRLREVDEDGIGGEATRCRGAAASIATVVGVVVGCEGGALLAVDGRPAKSEWIPLADAAGIRAFSGREGRPVVAVRATDGEIRVLDTRARAWSRWAEGDAVRAVVAAGDDTGAVVALSDSGALTVRDQTSGAVRARVAETAPADAALFAERDHTIVVGGDRALVIAHRDGAVLAQHHLVAPGRTVLTGR